MAPTAELSRLEKVKMKNDIKEFISQYEHPFDLDLSEIDLRAMCKNYEQVNERNGFIPLEDINKAINLVYPHETRMKFDPYLKSKVEYEDDVIASHIEFVEWKDLYLWPLFQRDVSPFHIRKIVSDFDPTAVITPCAIKLKIKGKAYYFIWDGHHTLQVCRYYGYTRFQVSVIDIDRIPAEKIKDQGFDPNDRIGYGIWLAGKNMIRINSKNKRKLHQYDEYYIQLETQDSRIVSIQNILDKQGVVITRRPRGAGTCSQPKTVGEMYDLVDTNSNPGRFLDRSMNFHRTYYPESPIILEFFRPFAYLYQMADLEGTTLGEDWDKEMADMIKQKWGDPDTTQEKIKLSFKNAMDSGKGTGKGSGMDDAKKVLNGLLNLYRQNNGKNFKTPQPEYRWEV